jgi:hypothetical protein
VAATPEQIHDALAAQIQSRLSSAITDLQVVAIGPFPNPTPPCIDIYPGDPFTEQVGFGQGNKAYNFVIRCRVCLPDDEAGKRFLLSMMDPISSTSVAAAIEYDRDLGSVVENLVVGDASGYGEWRVPDGSLMGCTWPVTVYP